MNKKLIVVGIAAALAMPFGAQAGVTVYGDANVSLDFVNNNDPVDTNEDSAKSLSSNESNIGFKGEEDLGNGLTVMWQIERLVDFDTGGDFSEARDTYVGLAGGFGTVIGGHVPTPYSTSTSGLDPFHDTIADNNALIGAERGVGWFDDEARVDNAIAYMTPDMNGFSASLTYVLPSTDAGSNGDDLPMTSDESEQDAYSLTASYTSGPLFVTVGYESLNQAVSPDDDITGMKLGGSYTLNDATTIGLIYETIDTGDVAGDRSAWALNVKHRMGDTTLMAAYGIADEMSDTAGDDGASQMSIGVSQALSKSTSVYALYTQVSNDDNGSYQLVSNSDGVTGEDMSAFSFGIKHEFSSK